MATAATASATEPIRKAADTRNLQWKFDNVGSKLLSKMGWKDGQAVGKRQRKKGETIEGEGMRVSKRQDGLGLGAAASAGAFAAASTATRHVEDFSSVLAALQQEHGCSSAIANQKKKGKNYSNKRSSSTPAALPSNKMTHAGTRQAKFQEKSEHDMKCIFGGAHFPVFEAVGATSKEKKKSKRPKREVDEAAGGQIDSSSELDRRTRKKKRKEEKQAE